MKRILVVTALVLVFGGFGLFRADPALAADYVVTHCSDDNELQVDLKAIQDGGGGTLRFNCGTATIPVKFTLTWIITNTTIEGGDTITLSGEDARQLFQVNTGGTLNLNHITLTHGNAVDDDGGAINNLGTLNVTNSRFFYNQATDSGGAIVSYGPLNITDSVFGYNTAGNGGALYPRWSGAVTKITGSSFHHNKAVLPGEQWGGAILIWDGAAVAIQNSVFAANGSTFPADGTGGAAEGGAIYVTANSSLTVDGSTLTNNHGFFGGAFRNLGTVTMTNSTLAGNDAESGGALFNEGTAKIDRGTLSGNTAFVGGGIFNQYGTGRLTVTNSTFAGNRASGGGDAEAGALINVNVATLSGVTLNGNSSTGTAGGISNVSTGTLTLTNATLSGNTAGSIGGGLFEDFHSQATLTHVTFAGNSAAQGGGIYAQGTENPLVLKSTIIGTSEKGGDCATGTGGAIVVSQGYNIASDSTCATWLTQASDLNQTNPLLGALANNGGLTQTHLPQAGSPGFNKIPNGTNGCGTTVTTDERGIVRPQGGKCDIGAVEVEQALPTATATRTATQTPTRAVTQTPVHTATPTATRTATSRPTATRTATAPACAGKPAQPQVSTPANGSQVKGPQVVLDWTDAACSTSYKVVLRLGSATGRKVQQKGGLTSSTFTSQALTKGATYAWQITAINGFGKAKAAWWTFKVK